MIDIDTLDAMERATIGMCDAEVIFQILMDKGIATREEIGEWRKVVAYKEPFITLFRNIETLKRMVNAQNPPNPIPQANPEAEKNTRKSLLRNFNNMKIKR